MAQRKTFSLNEWCPSCDRCNAALLDGCVEKRKKKSLVSRLTDRGAEICASAQSPIFFSHAAAPCFFVPSPRRKCLPHFISWGSNRGRGGGNEWDRNSKRGRNWNASHAGNTKKEEERDANDRRHLHPPPPPCFQFLRASGGRRGGGAVATPATVPPRNRVSSFTQFDFLAHVGRYSPYFA